MINYHSFDGYENSSVNPLSLQSVVETFHSKVLKGVSEDEILNYMFDYLGSSIPFDRVGIALQDGEYLQSTWVKSRVPVRNLRLGYRAKIKGSSLEKVMKSGKIRIIEDFKSYLSSHPESLSTELMIKDGMRSNLTFPLQLRGEAFGVAFFASCEANIYTTKHIRLLESFAQGLALVVERAQLGEIRSQALDQQQLLSHIIHDLRSPLGVIVGFTDLLVKPENSKKIEESSKNILSIIQKNASLLLSLIDDLHDLLTLKRNPLTIQKKQVVLRDFAIEISSGLEPICKTKGIALDVQVNEGAPAHWPFDPARIRQVLENLVSNAAKFSVSESCVKIRVNAEGEYLKISVQDQGVGIPQEELPKLFREFGGASPRPTGDESSTGLGLAICEHIVKAHGGTISARSELNKGSTFEFWLPN